MAATVVAISETATVRALMTQTGSGGVARWNKKTARKVVAAATARAPVGNPLNHDNFHLWWRPSYTPGCYKQGFGSVNRGGGRKNWNLSIIYNKCPHAYWVENGRKRSFGYELFTWSRYPDDVQERTNGTRGWEGESILFPAVNAVYKAGGFRQGIRSVRVRSSAGATAPLI